MRRYLFCALSSLIAASVATPAIAQTGPRVAIAASAWNDPADCRYTELQQKLEQTQWFSTVDFLDVITATPTLMQLLDYDAVITWSNVAYDDSNLLGDQLADYVDNGGGVVVAGFANYTISLGHFLGGRWLSGGYEVIAHVAGREGGAASMGTVLDPTHPIAHNVNSVFGSTVSRPFLREQYALVQGHVVMEWDDGRMLAAVSDTMPQRVDLGFHPVDSDCVSYGIDATSDALLLIANSLLHASGGSIASTYCQAVPNSSGAAGRIAVTGSSIVSDNDLTLVAADLPPRSFGIFMCSQAQGYTTLLGGGQGTMCLSGAVAGFWGQVQNSGAEGRITIQPDLTAVPLPSGPTAIAVGETWNFQAWFRDANPMATSNTTSGASVTFR